MDRDLFGRRGGWRRASVRGRGAAARRVGVSSKPEKRHRRLRVECLESRTLLSAVTINWATQQQTIAGFGSSSAWSNLGALDSSQQQLLWSTTNGAGLSILRSKILSDTSSSSSEIDSMKKAQAMGVTVFSTPWGPPAAWKSNGNVADIVNGVSTGGYLLPSHYQDYANWLTQYVINMHNQNPPITIYAVSMQNEPDWQADYESCIWTAQQVHDALAILHDTLAGNTSTYPLSTYPYLANVKIMLPEETHWDSLDLVSQVMSDPVESNYTNLIYADHTYGDYSNNNPITGLNGHQIWETEHTGDDPSLGIQAGLDEATSIYHVVGQNQASAYVHWWTNAGGGAGLLGGNWQSTKLYSAMENYSKFIRPGWVQVAQSNDGGLSISAFKNPATGDFATVLVNTSSSAITETINLNGAYSPVLTPWVTSATLDLAQQQSVPAPGNGGSFTYTIPAKSIVTLTGNATTTPVSEKPVGLLASAPSVNPTTSITLSWTNNLTTATGYTVQRSTNGTTWTTVTSTVPAGTYTYTDSGLAANTQYYYRVQANNGTLYSNVVATMTQPPAPTNLTATYNTSNQTVTLTFTKNGLSSTDYAVDVSTDGGVTWTTQTAGISSGSGSTNYTDTSAPELATLQYRVRAVYGTNSSAPTSVATVTTTILKAPTGFTVTAGGSSAVLKWTDNTTTNSTVSIERSTDGTNWTVIASVNHGVQTYTNSPVTEGGRYYYRIRNYDSAATPPTYSAYATASAITVPPAAPTHAEVLFSPLPTLVARLLWVNNSTSVTAYEVDRSTNGGSTWTTLSNTLAANSTSYTDTTVTNGQAYEYRVEALANGLASASVTTLSETASALPAPYAHGDIGDAATVGLAGSASYDSPTSTYTITGAGTDIWNNADGFQFAYSTLTGDATLIARVTSQQNTNAWAKAGVMFRNSAAVDAMEASLVVSYSNGVSFQWRSSNGGGSNNATTGSVAAPAWVKLVRSGNSFTAFYSTSTGVPTTWTQVGSAQTIAMATTALAGLAVTSHTNAALNTATFTNVSMTGTGNQPPTVATAAAASQLPPPNAATASLTVLGADDAGEGNLIYSWATSGTPPAAVVFSSNGQNASKNTVATFTKLGSYSFVVTITDQFGLSTTSTVNLTVNQTVNSIAVSPSGTTLAPNGQRQFTATAYDQFGAVFSSQPSFVWSSSNSSLGSIDAATGLYSATGVPGLQGITTVTATAGTVSGSSTVNVTTLPAPMSWYTMDAASGSTVADSSGNSYNGTATGSYSWTAGESSNALALGGGYATLPSAFGTALHSITNFTISGWVNLTSINNWARMFDFGTGTNVNMYLAPADGSGHVFYAITTGGSGAEQRLTTTTALATNTWTFLAVTLSGTTGTLYINGAVAATNNSMTLNPSSLGNTTQDYLGKSQYSDPTLQGSLDDVRIYNAGLSGAQVTQLYDSYFPPTVATPAAANPTTVTSTTTALSALGASILGESALKYAWSAIGTPPASVNFSVNGTNAAKSTVATFSQAGTYTLGVTIADTYGELATSQVTVNVQQTLTTLSVSPSTATINSGGGQQFTATAYDQFGAAMVAQPAFTWSVVSGVGSINSSSGLYTSSDAGSATVKAASGAVNNTASVTVNSTAPTVATPAAANPSPVAGATTSLSVLGASGGGEASLSYTWSMASGPAAVDFSANGTNAAKNATATFSRAGGYQFTVTITDQNSLSTTSTVKVTVNHTLQGGVSISPASANITAGSTQQFTLVGQDQFGQAFTVTDPSVSWQLTGPGVLGASSGLYTPPYASGSATVQATYDALGIAPATVTFTGQAQWNASGSASWSTGGSWKDSISGGAIAAPGTRGIFGDTVLFASATGPMARLDGANPTLAGITFNSAATSYTIAQGSGGSVTLQGTSGGTVSVLAGSHTISAPLHLASDTTFTAAAASSLSISGPIDGSGGVTLTGSGVLTLSGANSYTGPTQVNGGTLQFNGASANLGTRAITANGGAVQYVNATINGGTLAAQGVPSGTHTTLAGGTSSFSGTAISAGTPFVASGPTFFTDVTNYGPMTANSTLSWTGGTNAAGGSLAVNGTLDTSEFTTAGNITIANGGVLNNFATNLTAFNGAQITVNSGGTLNADSQNEGVALNLQNCVLMNNGTITGTTNVNYGATVQGSGSFGQVNLASGGILNVSPSANIAATGITVSGGTIDGSGDVPAPVTIQSTAVVSTNAGGTVEFSGGLTGDGSLATQGTGTVVLSGVGKYTGGTVVGGGTLIVTSAAALPDGSSLTVGTGSYFSAPPVAAAPAFSAAFGALATSGPVVAQAPSQSAAASSPGAHENSLPAAKLLVRFGYS